MQSILLLLAVCCLCLNAQPSVLELARWLGVADIKAVEGVVQGGPSSRMCTTVEEVQSMLDEATRVKVHHSLKPGCIDSSFRIYGDAVFV